MLLSFEFATSKMYTRATTANFMFIYTNYVVGMRATKRFHIEMLTICSKSYDRACRKSTELLFFYAPLRFTCIPNGKKCELWRARARALNYKMCKNNARVMPCSRLELQILFLLFILIVVTGVLHIVFSSWLPSQHPSPICCHAINTGGLVTHQQNCIDKYARK